MALMLREELTPAPTGANGAPPLPGPLGFIGSGKVGTALASLLHARGAEIVAVSGRTEESSRKMALAAGLDGTTAMGRAEAVAAASIVFLTVPDDAIATLCVDIAADGGWKPGQRVVHCSGALPSTVLQPAREAGALVASFHPLQTFASLEAALENLPGSTFAIEGDPELVEELDRFALALGGTALHLRAEEKTVYHAAAAIASNYTVTLAALASDLLVREGIAPDPNTALRYLLPLMRGTVNNLETLGIPGALTGPLARGDAGTVALHLRALGSCCADDLAELYRHLALLTLPLAEQKGHLSPETMRALRAALENQASQGS